MFTRATPYPKEQPISAMGWWDPHRVWYGRSSLLPHIERVILEFSNLSDSKMAWAQSDDFGFANWRKLFIRPSILGDVHENPHRT